MLSGRALHSATPAPAALRCSASLCRLPLVLVVMLGLALPGAADESDSNIGGATLVLHDMTYVVSDGSRNELVVEATSAEVKPSDDLALLHEVRARMGSKAPDGVPGGGMEMLCDSGTFDLETRDFVATGNVRGVTSDGRRFKTEKLRYRARDGLVWSESAVVLRDGGALLEGTGFEYRVRQDRFKMRDARILQEGS